MSSQDSNILTIREPARNLRVDANYDVVVAGGGIAGVAAAVAAAREGASVCLIEKQIGLGGLATLGIVTCWLPICNGAGRQVIGGIGEELLRLSVRDMKAENNEAGFHGVPACWEKKGDKEKRKTTRYATMFNPGLYTLLLEKWVLDAGVSILYDTIVCDVKRKRGQVTHVVVENKSGRYAIGCKAVVDATGDADVCHLAGEETETTNSNVASAWFYYLKDGKAHLSMTSNAYSAKLDINELKCAHYDGTNGNDVTKQVIEAHSLILRDTAIYADKAEGAPVEPFYIPSIPCFRATRRLVGEQSMQESDMYKWFDDTVGLTGDWRRRGPVFAITMRMLRGVANNNLLSAGRCYSMDKSTWDCGRVIPTCAITGEAAGLAAAVAALQKNGNVRRIGIRSFQAKMRKNGNLLSEKLVAESDCL